MRKNKMMNLQFVRDNYFGQYEIWVPLIQRNYKWNQETARKLARDLWNACKEKRDHYTIGMLTVHKAAGEDKLLLVDGQQRIITLILLLKYLNDGQEHFHILFERDKGVAEGMISRTAYLEHPGMRLSAEQVYTDLERFDENYRGIREEMEQAGLGGGEESRINRQEFVRYLYEQVYVLFHVAGQEPLDEFMNINCNKTRFGIADHIRAHLIMDAEKEGIKREEVTELFRQLAEKLYAGRRELWQLVSKGYGANENTWPEGRNRMEVLFYDCYEGTDIAPYRPMEEFRRLSRHNENLSILLEDWERGNWNLARGFLCLRELEKGKKTRFFQLSAEHVSLESRLLEKFEKLDCFSRNCFIQTQLMSGEQGLPETSILSCILGEKKKENLKRFEGDWEKAQKYSGTEEQKEGQKEPWIWNGQEDWEDFVSIYREYIEEKYSGSTRWKEQEMR